MYTNLTLTLGGGNRNNVSEEAIAKYYRKHDRPLEKDNRIIR